MGNTLNSKHFARWQDHERYIELLNKKKSNQQMTQSEDEELAKLEQTGDLVQGGEGIGNQFDKDEAGVEDNADTEHGKGKVENPNTGESKYQSGGKTKAK